MRCACSDCYSSYVPAWQELQAPERRVSKSSASDLPI